MRVTRAFNNNVVLAVRDDGVELVVMGKGLGYDTMPGSRIDPTKVDRSFVPQPETPTERLAAFLAEIPAEELELADEIVQLAHGQFGANVDDRMLIPFADHLSFVLRRAREGMNMDYPLQWEVTHLYPEEVAFSRQALTLIRERTGVDLPDGEASLLALHLVNAQWATDTISRTVALTKLLAQVHRLIERHFDISIPADSVSAMRFVTHVRYFLARLEKGKQLADAPQALLDAIRRTHPREFACAGRVRMLLELRLRTRVNVDEVFYLTLHIARLVAESAETGT